MKRTIKKCPICHKIGSRFLSASPLDNYKANPVTYMKCVSCEILYLSNLENSISNVDYSNSGYYSMAEPVLSRLMKPFIQELVKFKIRSLVKFSGPLRGKKLLDIGCGKGKFLYLAKSQGAEILGLEPTVRSYSFAKDSLGDAILNQPMKDGIWCDESIDVITLWHVFEHIADPIRILEMCRTVLRRSGLLVVGVPNYDSWNALIGGPVWFNLDPPRHLVHYNPAALVKVLEKSGFKIVKIDFSYPEITYFSTWQTLLNKFFITPNLVFNLLKKNKNAIPYKKTIFVKDLFILSTMGVILLPISILMNMFATKYNKSDCIVAFAMKT